MSGWLDLSNNSNLLKQVYIKGFVDVSGGDIINRHGNLIIQKDTSLNRLQVWGDVSINSNLFVSKDVTIGGRLNVQSYTKSDIIYTNVTGTNYTLVVVEDLSLNGRLNIEYDVSLNSRLFVGGDVSMNSSMYISGKTVLNNDVSMNSSLFIQKDTKINARLFTIGDSYINAITVGVGGGNRPNNTVLGFQALSQNTSGNENVAVGYHALQNSNNACNTAIGSNSLINNSDGNNNTAVGFNSGSFNNGGAFLTFLGAGSNTDNNTTNNIYTQSTAIGVNSIITESKQLVLGSVDVSNTVIFGNVSFYGNITGKLGSIQSNQINYTDGSIPATALSGSIVSQNSTLLGDTVLQARLFVGGDISANRSNLFVGNNVSVGGNLTINNNASVGGNFTVNSMNNMLSFINYVKIRIPKPVSSTTIISYNNAWTNLPVQVNSIDYANKNWLSCVLSTDNQYAVLCNSSEKVIYLSNNYFTNWSFVDVTSFIKTESIKRIAMSYNGRFVIVGTDKYILYSSNYGKNFINYTGGVQIVTNSSISPSIVSCLAISGNGEFLFAGGTYSGLYVSRYSDTLTIINNTLTGDEILTSNTTESWKFIASSFSANTVIAISSNYVLITNTLYSTGYITNGWYNITSSITSFITLSDIVDLKVSSSGTIVYITTNNSILKSTNSGSSWYLSSATFPSPITSISISFYSGTFTGVAQIFNGFGKITVTSVLSGSLSAISIGSSITGDNIAEGTTVTGYNYITNVINISKPTIGNGPNSNITIVSNLSGSNIDGQFVYAILNGQNNIYVSTDYANSFTAISNSYNLEYTNVAVNGTGTIAVALTNGTQHSPYTQTTVSTNNVNSYVEIEVPGINSEFVLSNDARIIGNLIVDYNTSIEGDTSLLGRLFVFSNDVSFGGNMYSFGKSILQGDVSMNNRMFVGGDVSMNNRLFVSNDVSFGKNIYALGSTILQGDVSLNTRMFVGGDVSMNARLFVSNDVSFGGNMYSLGKTVLQGDVSMNSRLFVGNDVTIIGRLNVFQYSNSNIIYTNVNSTNYSLVIAEDISLNGRLFVCGDVSMNDRLFVSNDVSFNGNMYSFGKSILQGDVSLNTRMFVGGDVSMNARLFVSNDVSFNGNMYAFGRTILVGDVSMNNRMFVGGDVSLNGRLFMQTGSNIYIGGFKVGSSTNITTTDTWSLANLVNSPPSAIIGILPQPTSTTIVIPWTYPTQINTGFSQYPLPLITSLTVQYTYYNGSSINTGYILQNATGTEYVSTYPSNINGTAITAVVLTNNSSAIRGYGTITINDISRYAYTFYDSGFANLSSSASNSVSILYNNYNNTSTSGSLSSITFTNFVSSGVPGQVLTLSFTQNTNASNPITLVFQYNPPQYSDFTNLITTGPTAPIKQYQITYSTDGSNLRYGGAISQSLQTITVSATSVSTSIPDTTNFYNFYPDSTYTFNIAAQNNTTNTGYGVSASTTVGTTYLNPVQSFTAISFPNTYTNIQATLVSNTASSPTNVYFGQNGSVNDWTSDSFASPINSITYRGNSTNAALTVNAELGSYNITATYSGFPITKPNDVTSAGLSVITSTPTDSYSTLGTAYQGFYLQTSNQVRIPAATLVASSSLYTLYVYQTQAGGTTYTTEFPFYFDTYSSPEVTSFTTAILPSGTTSIQVCGIWIIYGTINLTSTTIVKNLGNYFYNYTRILQYSGTTTTTEVGIGNVTSTKTTTLVSPTTITNTGAAVSYSSAIYLTSIPSITVTAYNQIGNTATGSSSAISAILDQPTYTLYSNLKSSIVDAILTTSASYGYRVYSGVAQSGTNVPNYLYNGSTAYSSVPFSNSWDLTVSSITSGSNTYDGTQEILIANGALRTSDTNYAKSYTSYYYSNGLNTVNYSGISSSGYRYVTFAWKVSTTLSGSNTRINISLGANNLFLVNSLLYADSGGNNQVLVYYRVEDMGALSTFTSNNASTYWVSVNDNATSSNNNGPVSGSNYYSVPGNNKPYYSSPTSTTSLITAGLPLALSTNTTGLSSGNIYVYVRIGLPMNISTTYLNSVEAYLSS